MVFTNSIDPTLTENLHDIQYYVCLALCKKRITIHHMDILWFKDLAVLDKTGNFSKAAVQQNVSQPAFSRRIKALEMWVGAQLVDRSSHPMTLTEAGRQMVEAGEQALSRIEIEREQIQAFLAQPEKYVITFATQHSIGWRFYPAWLQAFENEFGAIISRLRADDSHQIRSRNQRLRLCCTRARLSSQPEGPDLSRFRGNQGEGLAELDDPRDALVQRARRRGWICP